MTGGLRPWLTELARRLRQGQPGQRFASLHANGRVLRHPAVRLVAGALGGLLLLAGLVMCITPGPGLATMTAGLGVWALESRTLARLLDKAEVGLRAAWARLRGSNR